MNNERLDRFVDLMKNIFELDKSDLDFGIYRIMNIRKKEIENFLSNTLPQKVNDMLASFAPDTADLQKRLHEIERQCDAVGVSITDSKMAEEYARLKTRLATGLDKEALETDVYSALYSFFNRYYDEGDFISKRRYKEGVYALPYEGEEVKLYWANQDQYYIKTSENFTDYSFTVEGKDKPLTVHFLLTEATTEQDNNKETKDAKRTFMLYRENKERPDLKTFEYRKESNELIIRFVFDIPENKKIKYIEQNARDIRVKIAKDYPELSESLLRDVSTEKKKTKTLIDKYLEAYVAKNTFDYFIHKDLKGFLDREIDFYIKNEVIHLDDLDTDNERRVETYLAKARAIKRVGHIIIDFLAQVEDFQKKLWLKKKFVVETNWCMTLDQIDPAFWPEIAANQDQLREWKEMYAVNEISATKDTEGWSDVPSLAFLQQNQNLIVDTRYFSNNFKDRLIASIDDLDYRTVGILINSDNFHALSLLQCKYKNKIRVTYIDPPYNSPSSTVLYKNSFKDSAWLSLMQDRLILGDRLREGEGSIIIAIDKYEQNYLVDLCKSLFSEEDIVSVAIEHNKKGTQGSHFSFSNEFAVFVIPEELKKLNEIPRPKEQWEYSALRNWGSESTREDAANCFYPIYVQNNQVIGYGRVLDNNLHPKSANIFVNGEISMYSVKEQCWAVLDSKIDNPIIEIWPIDDKGVERKWRYAFQSINAILPYLTIDRSEKGNIQIKKAKYSDQFKTFWSDSKYNAGDYGTKLIKNMGFSKKDFAYPKSIYTVKDCIFAVTNKKILFWIILRDQVPLHKR